MLVGGEIGLNTEYGELRRYSCAACNVLTGLPRRRRRRDALLHAGMYSNL